MGHIRSFDPSPACTDTAANGGIAHVDHLAHGDVIRPHWYEVRPGVWTLVGNGLSNQTFIEGPEGIIAIDTGESNEEMAAALARLREVTSAPLAAVVYTHFHYVSGTRAAFDDAGGPLPVYGHERIATNLRRVTNEIGPAYSRGLVEQFGVAMPADGADALVHVGLGLWFRNPAHAPYTNGFVPPDRTFAAATSLQVAGLHMEVTPAPSDADDSVTLWFPDLAVCVHNLFWPALFNVFAIRGEEYRDPRVLLHGMDHVLSLGAEHLVGTHGPPISGEAEIAHRARQSRDAIQFLWDQTVRGINRGWTTDELASRVRLPDFYDDDYLTSERYGVAEHHVRQIHNGLRGWFDGDPAKLFPTPPAARAAKLIAGFGGRGAVASAVDDAIADDDLRWAAEMATWLVTAPADGEDDVIGDRRRLAGVLRTIGQRTPAANIRNWCITRARDLEGVAPLTRFRTHRLRRADVERDPLAVLNTLRVLLDPDAAEGVDAHLRVVIARWGTAGLHVRNCVAVATDGHGATVTLEIDAASWAGLLTGGTSLATLLADGAVNVAAGDVADITRLLSCFDLPETR